VKMRSKGSGSTSNFDLSHPISPGNDAVLGLKLIIYEISVKEKSLIYSAYALYYSYIIVDIAILKVSLLIQILEPLHIQKVK
jgi:hypothetical protein